MFCPLHALDISTHQIMNKKVSKKRADFKTPREKELRKEMGTLIFPDISEETSQANKNW